MTYKEKLLDPRWQKRRLEIFQRDDFTCVLCSQKNETLHVHHQVYEYGREPWEYPLSTLETYCHHCHSLVEFFKKQDPKILVCKNILAVKHQSGGISFYLVCMDGHKACLYVVKYYSHNKIEVVAFIPDKIIEQVSELTESLKNVF